MLRPKWLEPKWLRTRHSETDMCARDAWERQPRLFFEMSTPKLDNVIVPRLLSIPPITTRNKQAFARIEINQGHSRPSKIQATPLAQGDPTWKTVQPSKHRKNRITVQWKLESHDHSRSRSTEWHVTWSLENAVCLPYWTAVLMFDQRKTNALTCLHVCMIAVHKSGIGII